MPKTLDEELRTFSEELITVTDTAIGLTLSNIYVSPRCRKIELYFEIAPVRFRMDGTDPTSSVGEFVTPTSRMQIYNMSDAEKFKAIRTTATSGTIRARYKR